MTRRRRTAADWRAVPVACLFALGLAGCWASGPAKDPPAAPGNGSAPLHFTTATTDDPARLASGNVEFAFDLYDRLSRPASDDNLAFAPYSVAEMLATAYCGTRGRTASQMTKALHFGVPVERLPAAFGVIDAGLTAAQKGDARLALACGLWTRKGMGLPSDYREHVAGPMRAAVEELDFAGDPEGSREAINAWAGKNTDSAVRDLMPPGAVVKDTAVVLASAVHFAARWDRPFAARQTEAATFHSPKGDRPTQMMAQAGRLRACAAGGVRAVELPFQGSPVVLDVILPEAPLASVPTLHASDLALWLAGLQEHQVQLRLPRFQFSARTDLDRPLAALGMSDAFSAAADFSGLTQSHDFALSRVVHQAVVRVNEDGMSASAATGGSLGRRTLSDEPDFEFTADRPFLFVLRDPDRGVVLFLGRVAEPE